MCYCIIAAICQVVVSCGISESSDPGECVYAKYVVVNAEICTTTLDELLRCQGLEAFEWISS